MRLAAVLVAVVLPLVAAQTPSFTNPPVGINQHDYDYNEVWYVGQTQIVAWTTPFSNYSITLWQQSLTEGVRQLELRSVVTIEPGAANVMSFPWTVSIGNFDLRDSPVFFFWLTPGQSNGVPGNTATSMTSRYFNISSAAPPSSSSSTSLSSSSTQAPTTAPAKNTTSPSPAPSSQPTGLSTGAKAGIAVGVIIVVAVVIGLALFALRRRKAAEPVFESPQYKQVPPQPDAWDPPQKIHEHAELNAEQHGEQHAELHVGQHAGPSPVELG